MNTKIINYYELDQAEACKQIIASMMLDAKIDNPLLAEALRPSYEFWVRKHHEIYKGLMEKINVDRK